MLCVTGLRRTSRACLCFRRGLRADVCCAEADLSADKSGGAQACSERAVLGLGAVGSRRIGAARPADSVTDQVRRRNSFIKCPTARADRPVTTGARSSGSRHGASGCWRGRSRCRSRRLRSGCDDWTVRRRAPPVFGQDSTRTSMAARPAGAGGDGGECADDCAFCARSDDYSCGGGSRADTMSSGVRLADGSRDRDSRLHRREGARDQLVRQWQQFVADDKSHCLSLSSAGGKPTYTELLTCLELHRDARNLRQKERATTGQGR